MHFVLEFRYFGACFRHRIILVFLKGVINVNDLLPGNLHVIRPVTLFSFLQFAFN